MRNLVAPGSSRVPSAAAGAKSGRVPALLAEQARFAVALGAGKGSGAVGRLLHMGGGTSFPGAIARRIDPLVLQKVATASKARKAVITGSNGKTTTCRMLAAFAQAAGTQRRPEPVWIELDPGGDLGCRAGSRPAGQDRRPAAAAGSRRGDDATGSARGSARHDPGHQRLPRPARPIRRAVLDGTDAGGCHRGAACPRQRGPQRRRPAGGKLRPARQGPPSVLRPSRGRHGRGDSRARVGLDPLRALPARPDVPPGVPVTPRRLRVPRLRKQAAGPGHRRHPRSVVAGRGLRHHRRDAGRNHAGARAPARTAQRV